MSSQAIPKLIELVKPLNSTKNVPFKRKLMEHLCQEHKLLCIPHGGHKNVAHLGGERSYMLIGSLAKLERALMRWSMNELVTKHNFKAVVVPNILYDNVIERCGFPTTSHRSQVFKISANNKDSILDDNPILSTSNNKTHSCIAGTSEFALTSIHIGDNIDVDQLPKKYCAMSRCYRAETSNTASEWGLYRVRYFNKVEMVALTTPDKSESMLEEFINIQKDLFRQLDLEFQILDMPKEDLGLSASKKYDIEAWMGGRERYGEISSASNCTDYQSSRLNIKYSQMIEKDNQLQLDTGLVHTLNGTACSSIRTLIALIEQHQTESGDVSIPKALITYMDGITRIPTKEDTNLLRDVNFISLEDQ